MTDQLARRNIDAIAEHGRQERVRLDELIAKVETQGATIRTLTEQLTKLQRDLIMARVGAANSGPTAAG